MRRRSVRIMLRAVVMTALLSATAGPSWAGNIIPSLLLPGYGQASDGHYTKSAVFAGVTVAGWLGLFGSQLNYNRAVEAYDTSRETYLGYQSSLAAGQVVSASDISATYVEMSGAWDTADRRYTYRNVFAGALIVTYALNAVDVLMSRPDSGEREPAEPSVMMNVRGDRIMVVKSFHF